MSELTALSVSEMRAMLRTKKLSAVELTDAHLTRIESTNEQYNSFITICRAEALREARAADERLARDTTNSPSLCGIPVAIKDMLVTRDVVTTAGSRMLKKF